jgi:tetratricopeptide (TPR) repeat protein
MPCDLDVDPDVAVSQSLLDHGSIFGLLALVALIAAAWIYRKRWPLAAFGVFLFLLLLAPTSSFAAILDVSAEHRMYLPFLGLELVCLEFLRRLKVSQTISIGVTIVAVCSVLTYQRSAVWATPLTLWGDAVAKSPLKWRPRFQLAYAFYETKGYVQAVEQYEVASRLQTPDFNLLVDWAQALEEAGRPNEAIEKLEQAESMERSALAEALIGKMYAKQSKFPEALSALDRAQNIDPRFEMTYMYRGNIFEVLGDKSAALAQYQLALAFNPANSVARDALIRVTR